MLEKEIDWKMAAQRLGEDLIDQPPNGYYEFSAEQWVIEAIRSILIKNKKIEESEKIFDKILELKAYCDEQASKSRFKSEHEIWNELYERLNSILKEKQ